MSRFENARLTSRSSSEWKLMIAATPPGASKRGSAASSALSCVELGVHRDAQRLEGARRRIDAADAARADRAHDGAAQVERGLELALLPALA